MLTLMVSHTNVLTVDWETFDGENVDVCTNTETEYMKIFLVFATIIIINLFPDLHV